MRSEECCLQINLISGNQSTGTTDTSILYTTQTSPALAACNVGYLKVLN